MVPDMASDSGPGISAVMVSYQTGPVLFEAIAALLPAASLSQLIVVDNGNPAAVRQRLGELAAANSNLTVLSGHGNVGYAAACNLGAVEARAEVLLLINPDCRLHADQLDRLSHLAAGLTAPWLLGCLIRNPDGSEQRASRRNLLTPRTMWVEGMGLDRLWPSRYRGLQLNLNRQPLPRRLSRIPGVSGALMLMPLESYRALDGMDDGYFMHLEDLDFLWRFQQQGGEVWFAPDVVASHEMGTSAAGPVWLEWQKTKGFWRYFRKHFGSRRETAVRWCLKGLILARFMVRAVGQSLKNRGDRRP